MHNVAAMERAVRQRYAPQVKLEGTKQSVLFLVADIPDATRVDRPIYIYAERIWPFYTLYYMHDAGFGRKFNN